MDSLCLLQIIVQMIAGDNSEYVSMKILARFVLCLVSMMGLRLSPIGRRASMMMMMVMMMSLLIGDAGVLARRVRGDVADDQFRAIALGVVTAEVLPVSWFIQGLLATKRRMTGGLVAGGLVQILPGLAVISIQTSSTLRGTAIETGDGITIGRCTVTIVSTASSAVSI